MNVDRNNWDDNENWYRVGDRIAWWDRHSKNWIAYTIDENGYQQGDADYYANKRSFLTCEPQFAASPRPNRCDMASLTWKKDRHTNRSIWRSECGRFRIRRVQGGRYKTEHKEGRTFDQRGGGITWRTHKGLQEAKDHAEEVAARLQATE